MEQTLEFDVGLNMKNVLGLSSISEQFKCSFSIDLVLLWYAQLA